MLRRNHAGKSQSSYLLRTICGVLGILSAFSASTQQSTNWSPLVPINPWALTDSGYDDWGLKFSDDGKSAGLAFFKTNPADDNSSSAGSSSLYLTATSGVGWRTVPYNSTYIPAHILCLNESIWLIPGDGIIRTTDAGQTWTSVETGYEVYDLPVRAAKGNSTICAFGWRQTDETQKLWFCDILRSIDHGATWQKYPLEPADAPIPYAQMKIRTNDAGTWIITNGDLILRSNDDGLTWTRELLNRTFFGHRTTDVISMSATKWLYLSNLEYIYSEDGGATWSEVTRLPLPNSIRNPSSFYSRTYVTSEHFVYGENLAKLHISTGDGASSQFYYVSEDGGATWQETEPVRLPNLDFGSRVAQLRIDNYGKDKDVFVALSDDRGESWYADLPLLESAYWDSAVDDDALRLLVLPSGEVLALWQSTKEIFPEEQPKYDIFASLFTADLRPKWSEPVLVNHGVDPQVNGRSSPQVDVAPDGLVRAYWRATTTAGSISYDVSAISSDSGRTWKREHKVPFSTSRRSTRLVTNDVTLWYEVDTGLQPAATLHRVENDATDWESMPWQDALNRPDLVLYEPSSPRSGLKFATDKKNTVVAYFNVSLSPTVRSIMIATSMDGGSTWTSRLLDEVDGASMIQGIYTVPYVAAYTDDGWWICVIGVSDDDEFSDKVHLVSIRTQDPNWSQLELYDGVLRPLVNGASLATDVVADFHSTSLTGVATADHNRITMIGRWWTHWNGFKGDYFIPRTIYRDFLVTSSTSGASWTLIPLNRDLGTSAIQMSMDGHIYAEGFRSYTRDSDVWAKYAEIPLLRALDPNEDGSIDAVDVQAVVNGLLGGAARWDTNQDGQTDAADLQLIINAALYS